MSLLNLLFHQTAIPYNPKLNELTHNTLGSILFQQILYWYGKSREPFYKFAAPCEHRLYEEGDSWQEELKWTRSEFDHARDSIATKIISSELDDYCVFNASRPFQHGILYWTTGDRLTYYTLNEELLEHYLNKLFGATPVEKKTPPATIKFVGNYTTKTEQPKGKSEMTDLEQLVCSLSGAKTLAQSYIDKLNAKLSWYDPRKKQQTASSANQLYREDTAYKTWLEQKCIPDLERFKHKQSGKIGRDDLVNAFVTLSNFTHYLNTHQQDIKLISTEKLVEW